MTAGDVDALEGRADADLRRLPGVVRDLGGVQQRLGRDAAAVQAGAAQLVLLDQADGEAQLGGAQRRRVPAAAATEDDKVKVLLGHPATPLRTRSATRTATGGDRGAGCMGDDSRRIRPYYPAERSSAQPDEGAHGHAGGPRSGESRSRRRCCMRRPGDVEVRPRDARRSDSSSRVPTNSRRNTPASSMPPARSSRSWRSRGRRRPTSSSGGRSRGERHRPHGLADVVGGGAHALDQRRRRP